MASWTVAPDARTVLLRRLTEILATHRHDPAAAGLLATRAMDTRNRQPGGYLHPVARWWADLLDPAGVVAYEALLASYGNPVPVSMRDLPGSVMPPDLDILACGRAVLHRLHRASPLVLIEMAVLVNSLTTAESLVRARAIVAGIWARVGGDA